MLSNTDCAQMIELEASETAHIVHCLCDSPNESPNVVVACFASALSNKINNCKFVLLLKTGCKTFVFIVNEKPVRMQIAAGTSCTITFYRLNYEMM